MKNSIRSILRGCAAGLLLLSVAPAGNSSPDDLKDKYAEKLTHAFISHGGWVTDYDKARALAKEQGKVLFVYFTRSYSP